MFDNETSKYYDYEDKYGDYWIFMTQQLTVLVVTLVTLIYGVVIWCIVKKFHNYINFVFLNTIFTNFLCYLTLCFNQAIPLNAHWILIVITGYESGYFGTAKTHRLIVISHTFHIDIVRKLEVLFGWGISLITTTFVAGANAYIILASHTSRYDIISDSYV